MRAGPSLRSGRSPHDPGFHSGGSAVRRRVRPAGAVVQPRVAFRAPAADPFVGGSARDAHLRGHMRDRAARTDTFNQKPPAMNGQPGITVGHEDLRVVQS